MAGNVIEEYLVGIGADIDTGSFNSAMMAIGQLGKAMNAIKGAAPIVAVAAAIIGGGQGSLQHHKMMWPAADMEYKKLASQDVDHKGFCQVTFHNHESYGCIAGRYRMDPRTPGTVLPSPERDERTGYSGRCG